MAKTASINIRIDPETKSELEDLYGSLGLTLTDAINIFLHMSLLKGGIPFEVTRPHYTKETLEAAQEARDILSGKVAAKSYSDVDEAFRDIFAEKDEEEDEEDSPKEMANAGI